MKKILIFTLLLFISFPSVVFSNPLCEKLKGEWHGYWAVSISNTTSATINIGTVNSRTFKGKFFLANGGAGDIQGKCLPINKTESYLVLRKEPPWFNPCRGSIIQNKKELAIHFYCFAPDEWGYFKKI